MTYEEIKSMIEEMIKVDRHGDLYGHEAVAEQVAMHIISLEMKIKQQQRQIVDQGWQLNPDRMGGQFTKEELSQQYNEW